MKQFHKMLNSITSSGHYDQMRRFVAPLQDHFGINHLWYYRITKEGDYSFLGSHAAWSEFCFDTASTAHFPCLRHPNSFQNGISLMKSSADTIYQKTLQSAWEKFSINFHINLVQKLPEGMEAFGFASCFDDPKADERILNELPLLTHFIKSFRKTCAKLFHILDDNQVNLPQAFGPVFYESPKSISLGQDRKTLLKKIGLHGLFLLTMRELDVLHFLAFGYPASYIAKKLQLSVRTIENYISNIKSKLSCSTKSELIQKAQEIAPFIKDAPGRL
jgi:DNA-binding CsgD family transcriptional regulator